MILDIITDAIVRGWHNFLDRPHGIINFRFIMQPMVVVFLAVRAGIRDAKANKPAYLRDVIKSNNTKELIKIGWREIRTVFIVATVLDAIYQLILHQFIYPLELLFTVFLLVIIPYLLLRGPVNRLVRRFMKNKQTNL